MQRTVCLTWLTLLLVGCSTPNTEVHNAASTEEINLLQGTYNAMIQTDFGNVELRLYADKAPKAVTNFVELAKNDFYDGLTFHRTINGFVIQGGDPRGDGTGGGSIFGKPFEDEINDLSMERGVIAMANKGHDTNLSQFFIVQRKGGTPWLEGKHTVFGEVISGLDIVDKIANVPRDDLDKPLSPIEFNIIIE